jgi:hypothetical protein
MGHSQTQVKLLAMERGDEIDRAALCMTTCAVSLLIETRFHVSSEATGGGVVSCAGVAVRPLSGVGR